MIIGKLDRKIIIQTSADTRNTYGEGIPAWTTFWSCWSSVTPGGGDEKVEAGKVMATSPVIFGIRYKSGVTEKMRILYNSEYYNIIAIGEPDRRRSLTITAKKKE